MYKFWLSTLSVLILISFVFPSGKVKAQSASNTVPVYIVQEGDYLEDIAYRFHVSQQDLVNANGIVNTDQITVGQQLIIPGLEGIQGVLTTEIVPFGETLQSLSTHYHLPLDMLERLNHLTSPNELYAGYSLVIIENDNPSILGKRVPLNVGQSLLELAILNATDLWTILASNQLNSSLSLLPGDIVRVPGGDDAGPGALPPTISSVDISGLSQGQTAEIQIKGAAGLSIKGYLMEHGLNFFKDSDNRYIALQGVHAMAQPGLYSLSIQGNLPDGSDFDFSQDVLVSAGDFLYDQPLSVDPATLDPETTVPEDSNWLELSSPASPNKLWQGVFSLPVESVFAECYASRFGSRRSYNGSDYSYFHTGVDYCGKIGDPIYAAAVGVVVFAGPLTVRGNATMIDHGWGIYTAYMHQSEILVQMGDRVEQGQLIGLVGNTGRVEGPHLHFEVLVGSVQVNPLEWLNQVFP
ncbi:MAG: peptidoglycan DD-metalloendopeptidase family protein [Anaerolineales bacterium]|jgi:murein DD-endopeptidase MepM/ murein hydrolase activator NlpD